MPLFTPRKRLDSRTTVRRDLARRLDKTKPTGVEGLHRKHGGHTSEYAPGGSAFPVCEPLGSAARRALRASLFLQRGTKMSGEQIQSIGDRIFERLGNVHWEGWVVRGMALVIIVWGGWKFFSEGMKEPIVASLGIIAGNLCLDPFSALLLKGQNDGKVTIERTKLSGMKAHIVVRASHTFFPHSREVQRQTAHFLEQGVFL